MWNFENDSTNPIITAEKHINSCHKGSCEKLPKTAVVFYMGGGIDYLKKHYKVKLITENFPSFLHSRPVYKLKNYDICFLHGGWGAPMAADTVETLAALGVKTAISVGMFGAFDQTINIGDVVIPAKAFCEEGTSNHYYRNMDCFFPNEKLHRLALSAIENAKTLPIVTTDAVYRQTFYKEQLWRQNGAVGVDMETSAIFSVGNLLNLNVVSILIASDKHPQTEKDCDWQWKFTKQMRYDFIETCIRFAMEIDI